MVYEYNLAENSVSYQRNKYTIWEIKKTNEIFINHLHDDVLLLQKKFPLLRVQGGKKHAFKM